jgi:hypothetical protein
VTGLRSGTPTGWPGRFGARAVLIAGLVLIAGTLVLFAQAPIHGGYGTLAARGEGAMAALNDGYHLAFWIAASLVAVAIAVAATVLRSSD